MGAPILYCCIFAKTAGYYFCCLVGYFGMDEGIATVLKVNSSKLLQVVDTLLSTDERWKEELYYTTAIEIDIK